MQEERLLARYLEQDPVRADAHRLRVGDAYRALLGDHVEPGQPLAVVGPITPPVRLTGGPVPVTPRAGRPGRPRLGVAFVVEADGSVSAVELLARVPAEAAALAVLEQWHFEPARLPDGRAVPVHWVQSVRVRSE